MAKKTSKKTAVKNETVLGKAEATPSKNETDILEIVDVKADAKAKRVKAAKVAKSLRGKSLAVIVENDERCNAVTHIGDTIDALRLGEDDFAQKYEVQLEKLSNKIYAIVKSMATELYLESTKADREALKIARDAKKAERDVAKLKRKVTLKQKKLDKIKALQDEIAAMDVENA